MSVDPFDEVFGDIFNDDAYVKPAATEQTAIEQTAIEQAVEEIEEVILDAVEQAKLDKIALEEQMAEQAAEVTAIRYKRDALRKAMMDLDVELEAKLSVTNTFRRAIHEADVKISEAEHRKQEEEREAALRKERLAVVAGFKNYIDELNPEWAKYAFDHQWEAATTLGLHGSGLLADDMGLGKTLTSIMWLDMVRAHNVLIVTPSDTCSNFTIEMMMWAHHRFTWTLANQSPVGRRVFLDNLIYPRIQKGENVTLTINYEQLQNEELLKELMDIGFDTIIVDEAHNFKNKKSVLFNQLKRLRTKTEHVLPMTGTFILNKPQDIWPALHLVDPEAFPTENQFLQWYCTWDYGESVWKFNSGGVTSLMKRLGGRIVMRTMEEAGIKIPTQYIHEEILEFKDDYVDQRRIIKMLAENAQIILDAERKTSIIEQIALITRQRQAIVWPAGIQLKNPEGTVVFSVGEEVQESIKLDWVEAKVREAVSNNKRIAVFSQFKTGLAELDRRLSDLKVVRYDGDTDDKTKSLVKKDFDRRHVDANNGEYLWDIVLCNYKTGGVGLNFTHATEMVMLDEEWNPGKNEQAYRRIKRMGQTEETHVYIPRVKRSIDTWMHQLNETKRKMIDGFNLEVDLSKDFHNFLEVIQKEM
jgi:SNF2 family DNA or RNA helicase